MGRQKDSPPRVALLFPYEGIFEREVIRGVARYQSKHGPWQLLNAPPDASPPVRDLENWQGDGIIATVYGETAFGLKAERFADLPVPVVNTGNHIPDLPVPQVTADDHAAGRLGAEHLIECGLRRFAFAGWPSHGSSRFRQQGFRERLEEAGLADAIYPNDIGVDDPNEWSRPGGRAEEWIRKAPKPLGLMAWTDRLACRISHLCMQMDVAVPDEVALVGVNDDPVVCLVTYPPLSSVRMPFEKVGYEAARMLHGFMSGKESDRRASQRIAPLGVAARQSTNLLALDDEEVAQAVRFIRESADRPLSVPDVLQAIPTSRRSLERRFKEVLGRTINEEIIRTHLVRAKEHLANSNMPIVEVARQSGFGSLEHFHRTFRKRVGQTPAKYRNAFRVR